MSDDVLYEVRDRVALITLNRPQYRNAQSWKMLDELDASFDRAVADADVRVIVLRGAGDHFSSGHDLGTPPQLEDERERGAAERGIAFYENFRKYNLDYTLKWRNLPKPTIAMVHGYCIYGGWMIAAAMDVIFASEDARFLAALLEYFSVPWDVHPRKAKELLFESRFLSADEARELGLVNRVLQRDDLERETLEYAARVAENGRTVLRMSKLAVNKAQDIQGYSAAIEASFADFLVMMQSGRPRRRGEDPPRLGAVELALRGSRGERTGED